MIRHRAKPESPDELLAMFQFEGTPALQQARRALCKEFIDIFSTTSRKSDVNGYRYRSIEVGVAV
jgi:hypothetical protein